MAQLRRDDLRELRLIRADPLEQRADDALLLADKRRKQMQWLDLRIPRLSGQLLGLLHRLLGFERQFVESKCHVSRFLSVHKNSRRRDDATGYLASCVSGYDFTSNSASIASSSDESASAVSSPPAEAGSPVGAASAVAFVERFAHRVRGGLELADRGLDRVDVVALGRFTDLGDRRLQRFLIAVAELCRPAL